VDYPAAGVGQATKQRRTLLHRLATLRIKREMMMVPHRTADIRDCSQGWGDLNQGNFRHAIEIDPPPILKICATIR
jgi:hypothetical protein